MVSAKNQNLSNDYYRLIRSEITGYIVSGKHRVLDVGCGAGFLGAYLKQEGYASEVVGIEINRQVADDASNKLDQVICADLNLIGVDDLLSRENVNPFDYIVCGDVLEHLIDPWTALTELTKHLKPEGKVIVSLPNVRHWSVWLPLLFRGHWEYSESGIMDRTHLRFFTNKTALELINDANLELVSNEPSIWRKSEKILNVMTFGLCQGWLASQWVLLGKARSR